MKKYSLQSINQYPEHMVLTLRPSSGNDEINFKAGQYLAMSFESGNKPSPMRCFSIVSSPAESNIRLGMRSSGVYTKKLAHLKPGTNIYLQGPFGEFTVKQSTQDVVMMAAGIGITPFISILKDLTETNAPINAYLIYSSRNNQNIPFYDELTQLSAKNPRIKVLYTSENGQKNTNAKIYTGKVNKELLDKLTNNRYDGREWMICGPAKYMSSITKILQDNGVRDKNIHSEAFQQGSIFESGVTYQSAIYTYVLTILTLAFGIGAVALKDVNHYFEKIQNTPPSTQSVPVPQNTSRDDSNAINSVNEDNQPSQTTSNNSTYQSNTPSNNQTYQPPTSKVS